MWLGKVSFTVTCLQQKNDGKNGQLESKTTKRVTELGISDLHFSDWFKLFKNVSLLVHPVCEDEAMTSMNYPIGHRLHT
jgi:hypothetical protein